MQRLINEKSEEWATKYCIRHDEAKKIITDCIEDMLITKDSELNMYIEQEIEHKRWKREVKV